MNRMCDRCTIGPNRMCDRCVIVPNRMCDRCVILPNRMYDRYTIDLTGCGIGICRACVRPDTVNCSLSFVNRHEIIQHGKMPSL